MKSKILIIRNFASQVDINSYNLQEIGLGKAIVRRGMDCDVIYYSKENKADEIVYQLEKNKLTIRWIKAFKFMSNSIYFSMLRKSKLEEYDIIISTEYHQIMTFLLSLICGKKVYLYHGPYRDNNHKIIQYIYDKFLVPTIKNNLGKVLAKSNLAKIYLQGKGFSGVKTVGVGLDIDKITSTNETSIPIALEKVINSKDKILLYVGVLEKRRNIEFLLNVFAKLVIKDVNMKLVIVGDGKKEDLIKYNSLIRKLKIEKNIVHLTKVNQSQLSNVYNKADLFLFPTNYDIFGMVLLESMYFKVPIITTSNGGSETLMDLNTGIIIRELDEDSWVETSYKILNNQEFKESISENAHRNIVEEFTWDKVLSNILS